MFQYIVKRILIFIPTLFVISLLTFMLSVSVPGDPVEQLMNGGNNENGQAANKKAKEGDYIKKRHELGLDLPVFYFSLSNAATPDTLFKIPKKAHKENLSKLINKYGNWSEIQKYYAACNEFENTLLDTRVDSSATNAKIIIKDNLYKLYINSEENVIDTAFSIISQQLKSDSALRLLEPSFNDLFNKYSLVKANKSVSKNYIPSIKWYGFKNQYHIWASKFLVGDFGISYQDNRAVKYVIWDALRWTLLLSLFSMLLTYLISIPLGISSARNRGTNKDQIITTLLFILYSLPSFWIATMLIMFFGGGDFYSVFPAYGVGDVTSGMSFLQIVGIRLHHLFLPMVCYTYGSIAFISRQMRAATINSLSQDYVRTARAKGLEEKVVVWKHAFRNSLLPIITLFANIFPLAISGSIILEQIFSIPGMGKITIEAIHSRNYPIIFSVVMFSAILTLVGNLVSDILYAVVDPRISYSSKKS